MDEARIAFLIPSGFDYVAIQWAIWRAGRVAVPLCLSATEGELEDGLTDSQCSRVVATEPDKNRIEALCERLKLPLFTVEKMKRTQAKVLPEISPDRRGMILYTSGTTSKPKGVVMTHGTPLGRYY